MTTAEGNTVKVTTSPSSSVTKTVKSSAHAIHPGETVLVTGSAGANGAIAAQSIRVGAATGGLLGGGGGLFGASGAGSAGAGSSSGGAGGTGAASGAGSPAGSSGGEQALFGKGG